MAFIASHWLLWLVVFFVSCGYALYNQVKRMRGMINNGLSFDVEGAFGAFSSGTGSLAVVWVFSVASGALLLLSVIINLITYFR